MAETVRPYDAADYLRDEADVSAYLQAAAEDGDPTGMAMALGAVARARSMTQLARDTGITREGLYKALSPGGNPSFATVAKVAAALGHPVTFGLPVAAVVAAEAELDAAELVVGEVWNTLQDERVTVDRPPVDRPAKPRRERVKAVGAT